MFILVDVFLLPTENHWCDVLLNVILIIGTYYFFITYKNTQYSIKQNNVDFN